MRPATATDRAPGGRAGREAVLYARVSTNDQKREGFSLPAQERLLRDYAQTHGLTIRREFTDVETAKTTGRTAFGDMLAFLKKHREPRPAVLVEKTDRLYRNFKDYVILDDLHLDIHCVKEGGILSPNSRSGDWLIHEIRVVMARHYSRNLSEEVRKGMTEKARTGIWPSSAPLGYQNTQGPNEKRTITPDPRLAPLIKKAFTAYAKGTTSVKELARELRQQGLVTKKGHTLYQGTLHAILKNPVYAGWFNWKGERYEGTYTPLITRALYDRVQEVLARRLGTRERHVNHTFAYTGVIACAYCGCRLVGEIKKGKYVYFHCTGQRGPCPKPYAKEELLTEKFSNVLKTLSFPREILDWVTTALKDSHQDEKREHDARIKTLQDEDHRLQSRLDRMYDDKLDGTITTEFFNTKQEETRRQQDTIRDERLRLTETNEDYLTTGLTILELASNLHQRFNDQPASARQEILKLLLETATWGKNGLAIEFREPWKSLQRTRTTLVAENAGLPGFTREWPARPDSNRGPSA
jgi:site-specific DNA recombinase